MATLTGEEARAFHEKIKRENEERSREGLAKAKAEAALRGKEPFDLAALERLADTTTENGTLEPLEVRQRRFEEMYYVSSPGVLTIAELAVIVNELKRW
jgi:hypothetical protein